MGKFKYISVLLLPTTVAISFLFDGIFTLIPLIVFFGFVPLLELILPTWDENMEFHEKSTAKEDRFYDFLLYLMVPLQWAFLSWFLVLMSQEMQIWDRLARINSMGIMCGIIGINVGHELGHRMRKWEQFLGELLLLSSLENHFLPYHNSGHHANVGTPSDPATARLNESVYAFAIRSHFGSYIQAWQFEAQRLKIINKNNWHLSNRMIQYTLMQLALLCLILGLFGKEVCIYFIASAITGIVMLEMVNYIEHYGLMRKQRENGTYEVFKRCHAWNANQVTSRFLLFELSRHSDHHMKPDQPYQVLDCGADSPIMPTGYAGMMMLSFVPPLFFRVMNPRVKKALGL